MNLKQSSHKPYMYRRNMNQKWIWEQWLCLIWSEFISFPSIEPEFRERAVSITWTEEWFMIYLQGSAALLFWYYVNAQVSFILTLFPSVWNLIQTNAYEIYVQPLTSIKPTRHRYNLCIQYSDWYFLSDCWIVIGAGFYPSTLYLYFSLFS